MNSKKVLTLFLALIITVSSLPVMAEEDFIDKLNNFQDGRGSVHKTVARPISRYVLKKMGTPGFFISRYMAYRRFVNAPTCTVSEKLNFAANMLTLAGDITNHVLTLKHKRDLKKEFSQHSEAISSYLSGGRDLLKAPKEKGEKLDVQLLSLDYAIKSEEYELQRQKILRVFKYPALSMLLIAQILTAQEALSEASSMGTASSAVLLCQKNYQLERQEKEARINMTSEVRSSQEAKNIGETNKNTSPDSLDKTPWYIQPFMWLAGKGKESSRYLREKSKDLKESTIGKALDENRRKMNTANQKIIEEYGGIGRLESANYCEEMIVGVIDGLKKTNKNYSAEKALANELISTATRLVVRKAVKANLAAVDNIMRSPVGRGLVYAYHIRILYTEFESLKNGIANSQAKIAALKEVKASLKESPATTKISPDQIHKEFTSVFSVVLNQLFSNVYASSEIEATGEIRMCLEVNQCSKAKDFVEPEMKSYLDALPKSLAKYEVGMISNSYTVSQYNRFRRGLIPVQQFDLNRVQDEILKYEVEAEKLTTAMSSRKITKPETLDSYEKLVTDKEYQWYAPEMKPDFAEFKVASNSMGLAPLLLPADISEVADNDLEREVKTLEQNKPEVKIGEASSDVQLAMEKKYYESMESEYEFDDIHTETKNNIWDIISNRYRARYLKAAGE